MKGADAINHRASGPPITPITMKSARPERRAFPSFFGACYGLSLFLSGHTISDRLKAETRILRLEFRVSRSSFPHAISDRLKAELRTRILRLEFRVYAVFLPHTI